MKLLFTVSLLLIIGCAAQKDISENELKQLINQTDLTNPSSVTKFINKVSPLGQNAIPMLLKYWEMTPNNHQLFLIGEAICQIGDDNLYQYLTEIFNSTNDLRTRQASASLLFRLYLLEGTGTKHYGTPAPNILEIALFSMADTTIEFPNPDMANLAMLSFAGFEIFTLDIIKEKVYAEDSFTRGDYKSLQNYLTKWYKENKNKLIWDSEKRQFVF